MDFDSLISRQRDSPCRYVIYNLAIVDNMTFSKNMYIKYVIYSTLIA